MRVREVAQLLSENLQESAQMIEVDPSSGQDRAGRLAVIQGQLQIEEPEGNGPWPVIVPGDRVQVFYKDKQVKRPTVVDRVEDIALVVKNEAPVSRWEVEVSRDQLEVVLKTQFRPGTIYQLCDTDFEQQLKVEAEPVRPVPPKPIDSRQVVAWLREEGIQCEVFYGRIVQACMSLQDSEVVIAQGTPPVPPRNGRVDIVCELKPRVQTSLDQDRIDFRDRGQFNSVNPGDVLAYLHPPVPGQPGRNVYGHQVEPRPPKPARFKAGPGVRLIKNGTTAVAEITGRPTFLHGVMRVNPQLVIADDVSLATGHVEFRGDVAVLKNVEESLTVRAGGLVEVRGNVYHARIVAASDLTIGGKLIGGEVAAGVHQPGLAKAVQLLGQLNRSLEQLFSACRQLKAHPRLSVHDLKVRGDGYLIKLVLEARFSQIPKKFAQVAELLDSDNLEGCSEELIERAAAVRFSARRFLGAAPLEIKTLDELAGEIACLREQTLDLEEMLEHPAQITVHYCQKAKLEATGDIVVTGPLAYDCDMVAGGSIKMAGECRSGSYAAGSAIYAKSIGSKGMGKTALTVREDGVIGAQLFYPGVRLRIGSAQLVLDEECSNKLFFQRDGELLWKDFR